MSTSARSTTAESRQSLWSLVIPPAIWLGHFLVSYGVAALWCGTADRTAALGNLGVGFGVFTACAVTVIAVAGWRGWTRYRYPGARREAVPSHHRDTPEDRHRFLGLATALLAALSAIATLYVAIAVAVVGNCG